MIDWKAAFQGLSDAGYTDDQIAEIAGISRPVTNRIRNGTYPCHFEPRYAAGVALLNTLDFAVKQGWLKQNPVNP